MKLVADVNVSRRVVERLRALGFDVVRVSEVMDARSSDEAILSYARQCGAVLISHDQDFGALLAVTGASGPSFLNLRVSQVDAARLTGAIVSVLRATQTDLDAGAVVTLDDSGVRVHRLPIE
jgi:predicted nuclease of predicted toxin-antitoxin system